MIVIVDANILFSAIISPNGAIAEIIGHPSSPARLMSGHYCFVELFKHQQKILKFSKRTETETLDILYSLVSYIEFYNETLIEQVHWQQAELLTQDVDCFDVNYVALALQTGGWLWTGDRKLANHLRSLGFDQVVDTAELYARLEIG